MVRIGVDVRCFAGGKTTGVEEYARQFLTRVFASDQENTYVLFFNAYRGVHVDFSWALEFDNVELRVFHVPNKLLNGAMWYLRRPKLDKMLDGVDVFFMPNINFVSLSSHVKLILTLHDLSFEHHKDAFSWKRRLWHWFVNPHQLVQRADHVLAVSDATARDVIATYGKDREAVLDATSALPQVQTSTLSRNDISVLDVRAALKLPRRFFLYFGTLEPRKNVAGIVRAYTLFRSQHEGEAPDLVLAGTPGWKSFVIDVALRNSPYRSNIHIIHNVPEEQKQALYVLAECFVYPSFFEGFGFPPLEAYTVGTSVIASHTSSLPQVVGRHAVMIDPWRTEEIAEALAGAAQRAVLGHDSKGSDNRRQHAKDFTWKRAVAAFDQAVTS